MARKTTISTRREAGDASEDARARAEFARATRLTTIGQAMASIAHEIKQPLAAIVTNANAALRWLKTETPNVDEAKQALARIVDEGHRAADAVQNIRVLLAPKTSDAEPADVNAAVREVVALLDGELNLHKVTAEIDLAAGLPPVPIDRMKLQQVVLNLVTNAVEAMEPVADRPRALRIASKLCNGEVTLTVADCGIGIDADNLQRIFSPFFTTKPHALGIGLTICRSIVETQGGRVYAEAAAPRGTVFHVVLIPARPDGMEGEQNDRAG
jgi:C4-dicarboxylate-specific signal transduction histidine kinase